MRNNRDQPTILQAIFLFVHPTSQPSLYSLLYSAILLSINSHTCPFTYIPANLENSAVAAGLEKVSFHSNPRERQCQRMLKLFLTYIEYLLVEKIFSIQEHLVNNRYFSLKMLLEKKNLQFFQKYRNLLSYIFKMKL